METSQIIADLTSQEAEGVRRGGWFVITNSQNERIIKPLIPYLPVIASKAQGLKLGGGFAPNSRFGEYAIKVIEHYSKNNGCSCSLFPTIGLDLNPEKEYNNIAVLKTVKIEDKWIDYYLVNCNKCGQLFKVFERMGHWVFYEWKRLD
ncbi:hypothetical protein [Fulvivirga sediminis]|uniref:Uncharacterized protein n=1 Tax=Fulvivirga sediminis TaxID=2803949 RepID=A0A937F6U0_9BACT|nr:hypothetical protein [Fulvivirga sediminis]MBL3657441.1 hypothetical protein [Fulvivirga sediminis]